MVVDTTYYNVLELDVDAVEVDIKKSYRSMALKWHPDKNNHSLESTTRFQQITKAYQVLIDPTQRAIYDKYGYPGLNGEVLIDGTDGPYYYRNNTNNQSTTAASSKSDEAPLPNRSSEPQDTPRFNNPTYNKYHDNHNSTSTNFNTADFKTTSNINTTTNFHTNFEATNNTTHNNISTSNYNILNPPFLAQGNISQQNASDLFNQFFGDHQRNNSTISKSQIIRHKLSCSLAELYHGRRTKLGLSRRIICPSCNGKGGALVKCEQCENGRLTVQNGQYHQNFEVRCQNCKGTTEILTQICNHCKGLKLVKERKILFLFIKPGSANNDEIIFQEQGDQGLNVLPGDVVISIEELKHEFFTRVGNDLFCKVKIPLIDSLTGGYIYINHLNKTRLKIKLTGIIKPNSEKLLRNYGMPKKSATHHQHANEELESEGAEKLQYGNLIIKFEIEFPSEVNGEDYKELRRILATTNPDSTPPIPNHQEDQDDANIVAIGELLDYYEANLFPDKQQVHQVHHPHAFAQQQSQPSQFYSQNKQTTPNHQGYQIQQQQYLYQQHLNSFKNNNNTTTTPTPLDQNATKKRKSDI